MLVFIGSQLRFIQFSWEGKRWTTTSTTKGKTPRSYERELSTCAWKKRVMMKGKQDLCDVNEELCRINFVGGRNDKIQSKVWEKFLCKRRQSLTKTLPVWRAAPFPWRALSLCLFPDLATRQCQVFLSQNSFDGTILISLRGSYERYDVRQPKYFIPLVEMRLLVQKSVKGWRLVLCHGWKASLSTTSTFLTWIFLVFSIHHWLHSVSTPKRQFVDRCLR